MLFLFCNTGWMEHYNGLTDQDKIINGGAYVDENKHGHEICNFAKVGNSYYGFFQPSGEQVKIERLGARTSDEQITGVTVIWTATRPEGTRVVVGWYKNATIYRYWQKCEQISALHIKNEINGYRVKAEARNVILLQIYERTFEVPGGKGGMGQANLWYADTTKGRATIEKIRNILDGNALKSKAKRSKTTNSEKNALVEKVAIDTVTEFFEDKGYKVKNVGKDNVGWDLNAKSGKIEFRIEVKGLSGSGLTVELTHREYMVFSSKQPNYRLCVVHSALTKPTLLICKYSIVTGCWIVESAKRAKVKITPKTSASIGITI